MASNLVFFNDHDHFMILFQSKTKKNALVLVGSRAGCSNIVNSFRNTTNHLETAIEKINGNVNLEIKQILLVLREHSLAFLQHPGGCSKGEKT